MTDSTARPLRLFFALWPDGAVREALEDFTRAWRGRRRLPQVPGRRLHLTLVFIGGLPEAVPLSAVIEAAAAVRGQSFSLRLDQTGSFGGRRRILALSPSAPPAALLSLQQALGHRLQEVGLAPEGRVYHPHVSLLRGGRPPEPPPVAIDWPARDFVLVNSRQADGGPEYEILHRYPLGTAAA